MKALILLFIITFLASFFLASPEADSCTSNLSLNVSIPFDTTNLHCLSVWDAQSFTLRYVQTSANIWSFVLSTPDTNSYIAMGFSVSGGMVGSSAMVGWVASRGASGGIKQYYLGGVTSNQVVPDKGNLQVIANSTFITLQSSRLYMVFQLETTQPLSWLIFATGSTGLFPEPPSFSLTKHLDKVSTRIDYSKANIGSSQENGNSSQVDGNSSQADSCGSKLNLSVPLLFDTTNLNCLPVWNAQGYILRYSQTSPNIWSFILSAPNPNSYIAMGFSPNGGMTGSSAIVGWISSSGGGMKQYYLTGLTPNQVVPDRGNLKILTNSTFITSQSSRLYMAFQLQTNQPLPRLIYAFGPNAMFPSAPSFALTQHQDKVSISLNYATGSSASNPYMNLKKSHGVLNILGWGILIIMGAIVARYFKEWDPFWFYFHTTVQSLGFVLGVIGVISGLVLDNQLHIDVSLHKALGIIILVLGCLQVMAFLGRPKKESKVRKYWNLYHHNMGRILIILAVANIFYGIQLGREGRGWNIGYGVVLAILLTMAITFETQHCIIPLPLEGKASTNCCDSSTFVISQDSCSSNLVQLQFPIPFDTSSLLCTPVWPPQNYILRVRYAKGSSDMWSFIFSFPLDKKAYAAIGFSKDGSMVGSSAIVGWMPSPGAGGMKLYYLGGKSQEDVIVDKSDLYVMNASFVSATYSLGYLIFQLKTTQPSQNLLFAIGPNGQFPDYPRYALPKHTDHISITIDYSKGSTSEYSNLNLRRSHGVLNIMGWSIAMIIGSIIARYFKQWDPFWFYFHASIQTFGFMAGTIGILCGLLLSKKLNTNVTHHKNIAILIIVLGFLQVLAVVLRAGRESKIRKYWNWYHHNVGRILIIFAVLNSFYGLHLGGEGSKWFLAYGVTIAVLVIIAVVLEIRMRIIARRETRSSSFPQSLELAY
ncbi:Cytochrome b561 and DOMON domain-containing protein, partial [Mucuna pruriens]